METNKQVVIADTITRLESFIRVVEEMTDKIKVREDRVAMAVRVARLEQGITGLRVKYAIPSPVIVE
jgi:hypothetical protein